MEGSFYWSLPERDYLDVKFVLPAAFVKGLAETLKALCAGAHSRGRRFIIRDERRG